MNTKTFKLSINKLFRELRKKRCYSKQQASCCRTCSRAEFDDPFENWFFVFTTKQQKDQHKDWTLYIYWNYPENIEEIIKNCWLDYIRENKEQAICLLAKQNND